MAEILALDDDLEILSLVKTALERVGHRVETAASTQEVSLAKAQFAELILLDVMMPGEDGFSYCRRIRNTVDCPILFLTAKTSESDLVHGLGVGADDYLRKPFTVAELRARVAAHLRRELRQHTHVLHLGDFTLDIAGRQILQEGVPLALTKSEYAICALLMEDAGQVFSKRQIHETVFGYESMSDENAIVEHVKNIRSKLKILGDQPIETVWGIGYRWKRKNQ